jgi:SAM-dependent methyltransferase
MNTAQPYLQLVAHYEDCLARHGDSHLGVDWPNQADALTRYQVMLDVIPPDQRDTAVSLLDFGCGAAHLYEFIRARGFDGIAYAGLDLSPQFVELARRKFPERLFYLGDVLAESAPVLPRFDYCVLNGVLTEKRELTFEAMWDYARRLLRHVFAQARCGIAFNVMSKQVDWERGDLFHLPLDLLAEFLTRELSRHFVLRHDYGLYEYSVYVYHRPVRGPGLSWKSS